MTGIVFDIGGTNLRLATTNGYRLGTPVKVPVIKRYRDAIPAIAAATKKLTHGRNIAAIAGGLPGPLDTHHGQMLKSVHLPDWGGKPFARDLGRALRTTVFLENDNAVVALGEARHGAGKGYPIVGYVGIGTGINGCKIVNGAIDPNAVGYEIGHHFLNISITKHAHTSPHPGDWESLVSGSAIQTTYGKPAETIHTKTVWRTMERYTAYGLANVAMFWSPSVIVLGGSLMKSLSVPSISAYYMRILKIYPKKPVIVRGTLGDFGGLYGAMDLITQHL